MNMMQVKLSITCWRHPPSHESATEHGALCLHQPPTIVLQITVKYAVFEGAP
jgi:hypothetical protein